MPIFQTCARQGPGAGAGGSGREHQVDALDDADAMVWMLDLFVKLVMQEQLMREMRDGAQQRALSMAKLQPVAMLPSLATDVDFATTLQDDSMDWKMRASNAYWCDDLDECMRQLTSLLATLAAIQRQRAFFECVCAYASQESG
jgi:hypothetical protein